MEKQKTALQQAIDWIHNDLVLEGHEHFVILNKLDELLSLEKQQMEEAYKKGVTNGVCFERHSYKIHKTFDDYYKETYETE